MKKKIAQMSMIFTLIFSILLLAACKPSDKKIKELNIKFAEHGTIVLELHGKNIFVDPAVEGLVDPTFKAQADIVLITDIHGDHLNSEILNKVLTNNTTVIAPNAVNVAYRKENNGKDINKLHILANGQSVSLADLKITAVPMYNLTPDRLKFHDKGRGNGYIIESKGNRIYISGDTEDIPEMRQLKEIDFAFVCMNLPYTMTEEQAASAVLEFKPKVVYPYHYRGSAMSDVNKFKNLVAVNKQIEVKLLDWYK